MKAEKQNVKSQKKSGGLEENRLKKGYVFPRDLSSVRMINGILCETEKNCGGLGFRRKRQLDFGKVTTFWLLLVHL